jgi:hypothetical protein
MAIANCRVKSSDRSLRIGSQGAIQPGNSFRGYTRSDDLDDWSPSKATMPDIDATPLLRPSLAWLALLAIGFWYLWCDWRGGTVVWTAFAAAYALSCFISLEILAVAFVIGATIANNGFEKKAGILPSM